MMPAPIPMLARGHWLRRTGRLLCRVLAEWCRCVWVLLFLASLAGCSTGRAQVAVQTALTASAEAVAAADRVVAAGIPEAGELAVTAVAAECPPPCADWRERYRSEMAPWTRAVEGLEATHAALLLAQAGLDLWVSTGDLPGSWGETCDAAGEAVSALVELLGAVGVEVPAMLAEAGPAVSALCRVAAAEGDER